MIARRIAIGLVLLAVCTRVEAQSAPPAGAASKWEITDNSFLVEESFNQEPGVVQNIFTWTRARDRSWNASFTQEWPAPGMTHQLSYTLVYLNSGDARGIGDAMLNYRYQLRVESERGPAISPRVSVVLPTGRESDGLGQGTAGLQINVPASKQFGDLYVHANVGFTWLPGVQRTGLVAGSGIWRVSQMFNLMLEGWSTSGNQRRCRPASGAAGISASASSSSASRRPSRARAAARPRRC